MVKKIIYVSACALVNVDNLILVASREHKIYFDKYWEFPGGKLEKNETPEMCLIRELKEEINVDISKECIAPIGFSSFTYTHFHVVLMLYISRKWNGKILPREGNSLKWVQKTELKNLKMPEANKTLIPFILDLI
tara:strand:+ start:1385 stop:1789 length:405 start_codon:yes stop_codon:yes gene_type:complete